MFIPGGLARVPYPWSMTRAWSFLGWSYWRDGQRVGPVALQEIDRLVESGVLGEQDPIWLIWSNGVEHQTLRSGVADIMPMIRPDVIAHE